MFISRADNAQKYPPNVCVQSFIHSKKKFPQFHKSSDYGNLVIHACCHYKIWIFWIWMRVYGRISFWCIRWLKENVINRTQPRIKFETKLFLTLVIPSLARQRCLPSWGPRRTPWFFFFVISELFDTVDYSNYVFLGFWNNNSVIEALLA